MLVHLPCSFFPQSFDFCHCGILHFVLLPRCPFHSFFGDLAWFRWFWRCISMARCYGLLAFGVLSSHPLLSCWILPISGCPSSAQVQTHTHTLSLILSLLPFPFLPFVHDSLFPLESPPPFLLSVGSCFFDHHVAQPSFPLLISLLSLLVSVACLLVCFLFTGSGTCQSDLSGSFFVTRDESSQQIFRVDFPLCSPKCSQCANSTWCARGACFPPYLWSDGKCFWECPRATYLADAELRLCGSKLFSIFGFSFSLSFSYVSLPLCFSFLSFVLFFLFLLQLLLPPPPLWLSSSDLFGRCEAAPMWSKISCCCCCCCCSSFFPLLLFFLLLFFCDSPCDLSRWCEGAPMWKSDLSLCQPRGHSWAFFSHLPVCSSLYWPFSSLSSWSWFCWVSACLSSLTVDCAPDCFVCLSGHEFTLSSFSLHASVLILAVCMFSLFLSALFSRLCSRLSCLLVWLLFLHSL